MANARHDFPGTVWHAFTQITRTHRTEHARTHTHIARTIQALSTHAHTMLCVRGGSQRTLRRMIGTLPGRGSLSVPSAAQRSFACAVAAAVHFMARSISGWRDVRARV